MKNRLRHFIGLWLLIFVSTPARSQILATLPSFRIARTDKTYFTNKDLPKNKPVLLIYFQPDCEDCIAFTKALMNQVSDFKQVEIVMVTNTGLSPLITFEREFKLRKYRNLVAGTESFTMVLQRALNVKHFPYAAAYTSNRRLTKVFQENNDAKKLINQITRIFKSLKKETDKGDRRSD